MLKFVIRLNTNKSLKWLKKTVLPLRIDIKEKKQILHYF
jgi:hypothetical protein